MQKGHIARHICEKISLNCKVRLCHHIPQLSPKDSDSLTNTQLLEFCRHLNNVVTQSQCPVMDVVVFSLGMLVCKGSKPQGQTQACCWGRSERSWDSQVEGLRIVLSCALSHPLDSPLKRDRRIAHEFSCLNPFLVCSPLSPSIQQTEVSASDVH